MDLLDLCYLASLVDHNHLRDMNEFSCDNAFRAEKLLWWAVTFIVAALVFFLTQQYALV